MIGSSCLKFQTAAAYKSGQLKQNYIDETTMCSRIQTRMNRNQVAHGSFITNKKQLYSNENYTICVCGNFYAHSQL